MNNKISNNNLNKIVLATRTDKNSYDDCVKELEKRFNGNSSIVKIYIICNLPNKIFKKGSISFELLFDKDPTRQTSFNKVIKELKKNNSKYYHLLTFSKEVNLQKNHITKMVEEINKDKKSLIVVGYRLKNKANILSRKEFKLFANGDYNTDNIGIAYQVPWNTCALWNKEFVYGKKEKRLRFDEICEKNQLGKLIVRVNDDCECTGYIGMEDGLAIAELVTKNRELKYKLIEKELRWDIEENRKKDHKIKMARKNIVLSTFMNIKGYSIDKLREAAS